MYKLVLRREAIDDIQESFDWYESQSSGLGDEFKTEVETGLLQLSKNPLYYTSISKNLRRYRIRRFPFLIIYGIDKKKIIVTGVRHMSRKSK